MTLIPGIRLVPADEPADYWHDTDRARARSEQLDRQVARAMNADNYLTDRQPFGSRPQVVTSA